MIAKCQVAMAMSMMSHSPLSGLYGDTFWLGRLIRIQTLRTKCCGESHFQFMTFRIMVSRGNTHSLVPLVFLDLVLECVAISHY